MKVTIIGTVIWCLLVVGFFALSFALDYAAIDSLIFGSWVFIALIALLEMLLPAQVIAWRNAEVAARPPQMKAVGAKFSELFGIKHSGDPTSQRNLRILGFGILLGDCAIMYGLYVFVHTLVR